MSYAKFYNFVTLNTFYNIDEACFNLIGRVTGMEKIMEQNERHAKRRLLGTHFHIKSFV